MESAANVSNRSIDLSIRKEFKKSIIDKSIVYSKTLTLRTKLHDETLGEHFVWKCLNNMSEYQIDSVTEYVIKKANTPGRAFVSLCTKIMNETNHNNY